MKGGAWLLLAACLAGAAQAGEPAAEAVTGRESADDLARLHLWGGAIGDVLSRQVGGEVGLSWGAHPLLDVGAEVLIGSATGARLVASLHPGRAEQGLLPMVQVRVALHPVPGALALGGGLGVGATLEAGPGRVFALAGAEWMHGPPQYLPWAALVSLGYEADFFRTHHTEASLEPQVREVVRVVHETAPVPTTGVVTGKVWDLDDKPLTAVVRLPFEPGALGQRTWDAAPEFTLQLPPGDHVVEAEAPGYLVRGRKVHLVAGQTVVLDIALRKLPNARGAVLTATQVEINQSVQFATNEARLLPESFGILDEVVDVLIRNPALVKLRVEGHTDQVGTAERNDALSAARAEAVRAYLVEKGVAAERLLAVGFGFQKPVASNATEAGRARNRRVQFVIVEKR